MNIYHLLFTLTAVRLIVNEKSHCGQWNCVFIAQYKSALWMLIILLHWQQFGSFKFSIKSISFSSYRSWIFVMGFLDVYYHPILLVWLREFERAWGHQLHCSITSHCCANVASCHWHLNKLHELLLAQLHEVALLVSRQLELIQSTSGLKSSVLAPGNFWCLTVFQLLLS